MVQASNKRASTDLPGRQWSVCVHGSFRLKNPAGEIVRFQNAKVEALFAVLVNHREFGVARDELAAILWPGKPIELQRSSLRQALALCRQRIGAESLDTTRSHCRLADEFEIQVLPASGVFMPGHEGDFFDDFRRRNVVPDQIESDHRNLLGAWLQVLEWNSINDPAMFFKMLQIAPNQAEGIAFSDLERLLVRASSVKKDAWAEYWWGTVLDDLGDCQRHLRLGLGMALEREHLDLASKICLELGRAYSRMGQLRKALAISKLADDIAQKSKDQNQSVSALRLKATLNYHWGDPSYGNMLMTKAIHSVASTMEQCHLTACLALFQSGFGFESEAKSNLSQIDSYATTLGHAKINLQFRLTQRILVSHSSDSKASYNKIYTESRGATVESEQIVSYTQELLVSLCNRSGDQNLGIRHGALAAASRRKTKDVTTNWVRNLRGEKVVGPALT